MRIATWNVNSLKSRLERVTMWLERAKPDLLLLQETKLTDAVAPHAAFAKLGYDLAHHGEGGRNGVAIIAKHGIGIDDVVVNFGQPRPTKAGSDVEPLTEARIMSVRCGDLRVINVYAPNGRVVDTPPFAAKLVWYELLAVWMQATFKLEGNIVIGGDFNVTADDRDVWDAKSAHGGTHVTERERAAFAKLLSWGLIDSYRIHHTAGERFTWWDYRAGDFFKNFGMRNDYLLVSPPVAKRTLFSAIDREARKGKPTPSDHAPYLIDLDEPGKPLDPPDGGWKDAEARIAARRAGKRDSE